MNHTSRRFVSAPWLGLVLPGLLAAMVLGRAVVQDGGPDRDRDDREDAEERSLFEPDRAPPAVEGAASHCIQGSPVVLPFLVGGRAPRLGGVACEPGVGDHLVLFGAEGVEEVRPEAGQIVQTAAVNVDGALHLAWTEVGPQGPSVWTAVRGSRGWGPAQVVAPAGASAQGVALARRPDGSVWAVWQQFIGEGVEGGVDLVVRGLDPPTEPVRLTHRRASDFQPSVAPAADGSLWIAWTRWDDVQYDVLLGRYEPGAGSFAEVHPIGADPIRDDLNPSVVLGPDGAPWVAYDSLHDAERGASLHAGRPKQPEEGAPDLVQVRLARWSEGRVQLPAGVDGLPGVAERGPRLTSNGGTPSFAFDGRGRLHLAVRLLGPNPHPSVVEHALWWKTYEGEGWSEARPIAGSLGRTERAPMIAVDGQVWLAWANQPPASPRTARWSRPDPQWPGFELSQALPDQGLGLLRLDAGEGPPVACRTTPQAAPTGTPRSHHLPDHQRAILAGREHHLVRRGEREWKVYWGDLHRHSNYSNCSGGWEPSPELRHASGRDVMGYDFYCLTDHSGQLDPLMWWALSKQVDLHPNPRFVTLQGYEWSHSSFGHLNVILRGRPDRVVSPRLPRMSSPADLWASLPPGDVVTIPHHSSQYGRDYRWAYADPDFLRVVEVFQACRGSFEFPGSFRAARWASEDDGSVHAGLNRGLRFGLVAGTDHGNGASYAAVLAERLDRDSLFEALAARRTYASTTKGMLLDFGLGDAVMGEEVQLEGPARFQIEAKGTRPLSELIVYRDGEVVHSVGRAADFGAHTGTVQLRISLDRKRASRKLPEPVVAELVAHEGRFRRAPGTRKSRRAELRYPFLDIQGARSTWTVPEDVVDTGAHTRFELRAEAGCELELSWTGGERPVRLGLSELLEGPFVGRIKRRAGLALRLELVGGADNLVDPSRDLGTDHLRLEWTDPHPPAGDHWYAIRVVQNDGEIAWSSPIFVQRAGSGSDDPDDG